MVQLTHQTRAAKSYHQDEPSHLNSNLIVEMPSHNPFPNLHSSVQRSVSERSFPGGLLSPWNRKGIDWAEHGLLAHAVQNLIVISDPNQTVQFVQTLEHHRFPVTKVNQIYYKTFC